MTSVFDRIREIIHQSSENHLNKSDKYYQHLASTLPSGYSLLVFNALELGVPRFFLGLEGGEGKVYYPDGRIRNVQGVAITGGYSSKLTTTSFEVEIGVFKGDPVGPAIQAEYATIHGYGISVPGEMGRTILDLDSPSNPNTIPTSIDEIFETLPNGSGIYGITGTALDAAIELQYIYIADRSQNFTIFHSLWGLSPEHT